MFNLSDLFILGCNQLIIWFAPTTRTNLELKNLTVLGWKMKFNENSTFFYKILFNCSFSHQLISYCDSQCKTMKTMNYEKKMCVCFLLTNYLLLIICACMYMHIYNYFCIYKYLYINKYT